ncbi:biliverdin-producing heme oxygenase [Aureimonas sp. ME7]|uniref:biliverdin-producing heme oxygenase n=1 Tax=Aureimonas sp. ME7 TaxID=2744252 RepID=UPI0015F6DCE2|nr:biliverdin-producing heme oxygenase [Aureimonas sp. ME7]
MTITDAPAAARPSLRDRLRSDTREAHEALDASFADMFGDAEGARYRRFLRMNHLAHEAIEPILSGSPLDWTGRDAPDAGRLAAVRRDAEAIGLPPEPAPGFPIENPDLPEALGIAYVLEGSRLGAKFMLRALKREGAGSGDPWPTAYLEASSDARPFAHLIERMDAEPMNEGMVRRAVSAADETFRFFQRLAEDSATRTIRV